MSEEHPGGQCGRCEVRNGENSRRLEATEEGAGSGARRCGFLKTMARVFWISQVSPRLEFIIRDSSFPVHSHCRRWAPPVS